MEGIDIQAIVRQAIQDYQSAEQAKSEPAHRPNWWKSGGGESSWNGG